MAARRDAGVVSATDGEVFRHPGLHVADGAVMPSAIGPNLSLTIAAVADHSLMASWPLADDFGRGSSLYGGAPILGPRPDRGAGRGAAAHTCVLLQRVGDTYMPPARRQQELALIVVGSSASGIGRRSQLICLCRVDAFALRLPNLALRAAQ
jgi:hypothetical protein